MLKLNELKRVYTKDYLILMGIGFLPLLWKILEVSFLSSYDNALKILGQIALISIIFKVFEESILNTLYKFFSKQNINDTKREYFVKKFLMSYFLCTLVFTIAIFFLCPYILKISKVPDYIFNETLSFVKLYVAACGLGVISKYLYTCSLIGKETKKMGWYLFIKSIITAILFVILVPKFSLGFGVQGIAIAEIIINVTTIIYLSMHIKNVKSQRTEFNFKEYFKLFLFSFVETLIRNVVYYFVILVFLNVIDNQDIYFVSNEYIWSIMLVPVLAQASIVKQEIALGNRNLKPYFMNAILLVLFMVVLIPMALIIFKFIYGLTNYLDYFVVLVKLFPCYIIFVFDSIIEAYFIATGKMKHILVQTILTNIFVYCTALILYLCGVWTITLDSIILLFNLGVIVSSIYTISVYLIENKKESKNILN